MLQDRGSTDSVLGAAGVNTGAALVPAAAAVAQSRLTHQRIALHSSAPASSVSVPALVAGAEAHEVEPEGEHSDEEQDEDEHEKQVEHCLFSALVAVFLPSVGARTRQRMRGRIRVSTGIPRPPGAAGRSTT